MCIIASTVVKRPVLLLFGVNCQMYNKRFVSIVCHESKSRRMTSPQSVMIRKRQLVLA